MKVKKHNYEGDSIKVSFDLNRCIHAAECLTNLPEVFDAHGKPWIRPDKAKADRIAATVELCPTGALHYERKDGGREETGDTSNVAAVAVNGPVYVRGKLKLVNAETGETLRETRAALCRCGSSKNRPFCDNSHSADRFFAPAELKEDRMQIDEAAGSADGTLEISYKSNGSYAFKGHMELRDRAGNLLSEGDCAWLCSCGLSANKPFCDGSHKR